VIPSFFAILRLCSIVIFPVGEEDIVIVVVIRCDSLVSILLRDLLENYQIY